MIVLDTETASPASLGYPWLGAVAEEGGVRIYYAIQAGALGIGTIEVTG